MSEQLAITPVTRLEKKLVQFLEAFKNFSSIQNVILTQTITIAVFTAYSGPRCCGCPVMQYNPIYSEVHSTVNLVDYMFYFICWQECMPTFRDQVECTTPCLLAHKVKPPPKFPR